MSIKLKAILDQILKEAEEKTYTVDYWYRYGNDDKEMDDIEVKATSEEEAIKKAKEKAKRGAIQSSFKAKEKSIKEDFKRFDFQNTTGGGGRRFIPNQGIIPSSMFNDKDFMLSNDGTKLYMDPLLVNAIVNSKTLTNRAAQVRYQEFKEKMGPHFQQFKKGLEGRLSKVLKSGKPFEVWNGTIMTNKKGQIVFPYSDIGTIAENEEQVSELFGFGGNKGSNGDCARLILDASGMPGEAIVKKIGGKLAIAPIDSTETLGNPRTISGLSTIKVGDFISDPNSDKPTRATVRKIYLAPINDPKHGKQFGDKIYTAQTAQEVYNVLKNFASFTQPVNSISATPVK